MSSRNNKAAVESKKRLQAEVAQEETAIVSLTGQLDRLTEKLKHLNGAENAEEVQNQIAAYQRDLEKNPRNISAEDSLDNIVRLENSLHVVQRRNAIIKKEIASTEKIIKDRGALILKATNHQDVIVNQTGWCAHKKEDFEHVQDVRRTIEEMRLVTKNVELEHASAKPVIRKKEELIMRLSAEVAAKRERHEQIALCWNDVRVRERAIAELRAALGEQVGDDASIDKAIAKVESQRGASSIDMMRKDKDYLKEAYLKNKQTQQRQDSVQGAQMDRIGELQERLDMILDALKVMKPNNDFERTASRAIVPVSSVSEPQTPEDVLCKDEMIPAETYRFVIKATNVMRTDLSKKYVLILEKQSVVQSLEAKLNSFMEQLQKTSTSLKKQSTDKEEDMSELVNQLQSKHREYRAKIEELIAENSQLKAKVFKAAPKSEARHRPIFR